jgi:hypothetical protein
VEAVRAALVGHALSKLFAALRLCCLKSLPRNGLRPVSSKSPLFSKK